MNFSDLRAQKIGFFAVFLKVITFVSLLTIIAFVLLIARSETNANEGGSPGGKTNRQTPTIEEMFPLGFSTSTGVMNGVQGGANLSTNAVGQVAMYRLYNPYSGEHFYTSDKAERDGLIKIGWKSENIGWVAPASSNTPVYRLYNSHCEGGDHHYTASKKEYDDLKKVGWTQEGICWYSVDSDSVYKAAIYRQYNPNQFSCNHNYTIDTKERDVLLNVGWNDEGVAYYGLDFSKMSELDFSKFTVDTSNKTYNGTQFKPSVTSAKYKLGTDYVVTYGENKNVGTGTITVNGTGTYYGTKTYTFTIEQKTVTSVNWSETQFEYTGKAQVPSAKAVGLCGKDTANVTVVASGEHIKTGIYTASATEISNKNYKLAKNIKTAFKINPATIDYVGKNKARVDTSDEMYTGVAITKEISVDGLVEGKDYEVAYKDNTDAGTATVTIKGIDQHEGEASFTFQIKPISLEGAVVALGESLTYNGHTQTQEVTKVTVAVDGKETEVPLSALTILNNTGKDADDYEMTVSASGNFTGSATQAFSIAKKKIMFECKNDTFEYDKQAHVPTLDISGAVEGEIVDYSVSISSKDSFTAVESAVNAGSYAVSPILQGDSAKNYEFDQTSKDFTITKAIPTYTPGTLKGKLNESLSTVELPEPSSTDTPGRIIWYDDTTVMGKVGEQTFIATFYPTDMANYEWMPMDITVKVTYPYRGYWLGTKNAGAEYVDEAYFEAHDANYVSGGDISADMEVLHDSSNANYATVKAKWDKFYSDDNVRLYATYEGGEKEGSWSFTLGGDGSTFNQGEPSELNKYLEFRILEVSGAGGHKLSDGITSDGSAVTFMATHVLPTAYQMNATKTNDGGWGACQLYKDLNKVSGTEGKIYSKFSDDFVSQVKAVTKEYNIGGSGNSQIATPNTVDCQFWILSYTELVSPTALDYVEWLPKLEGTQYAWCAKNVTSANYNNSCLQGYRTRGGRHPGFCMNSIWWERTPDVNSTMIFSAGNTDGAPINCSTAWYRLGVIPAFSM